MLVKEESALGHLVTVNLARELEVPKALLNPLTHVCLRHLGVVDVAIDESECCARR